MSTGDIISLTICCTFIIAMGTCLIIDLYQSGYKSGQIDMMNNKQKIHLIEFEDGERVYVKNPKQKDYKMSFKIIK